MKFIFYLKEPQGLGQSSNLLLQGKDAGDHLRLPAGVFLQIRVPSFLKKIIKYSYLLELIAQFLFFSADRSSVRSHSEP